MSFDDEEVKTTLPGTSAKVSDDEIKKYSGADAYGPDAMAAVNLAKKWTGGA